VHGVQFDERGFLRGGPANTGMVLYELKRVGRDRVAVTGNVGRRPERGRAARQAGPHCEGTIDRGRTLWDDDGLLRIASPAGPRTHEFVLLRGDLVIESASVRMCMPSADQCTWALAAPGIDRKILAFEHTNRLVFHGPYAGRIRGGTVTEIFAPTWQ
jgi:hypothetical protein